MEGFASQANEFSAYMLLASNFILNQYVCPPDLLSDFLSGQMLFFSSPCSRAWPYRAHEVNMSGCCYS